MAQSWNPKVVHGPYGRSWVVSDEGNGWKCYVRVVPQAGRPVVGSLHLLPSSIAHDDSVATAMLDDQIAHMYPSQEDVPLGGLTTRALRRIKLGEALDRGRQAIGSWLQDEKGGLLARAGFTRDGVRAPHRAGRRGHSDSFYATVADAYCEALARGSRRPVVEAAESLSAASGGAYDATYVRDLLHVARRRSLLTDPPRGRAGGELTKRALEVLEGDREEQR